MSERTVRMKGGILTPPNNVGVPACFPTFALWDSWAEESEVAWRLH